MRISEIGGEEVLVTTDDCGHIAVHFPKDNFVRPALTMKVPLSAWGIDTHSSKRLLAISCNAHIVTLFHLGMGVEGWEWTTTALEPEESFPRLVLAGHYGNIPCVAFDDSGNWVASGSLDRTIRLWDCKNGIMVRQIPGQRYVSN